MTSDGFGPQAEVLLCAEVTYNEYPVQQKLVGFEIYHQGATIYYDFAREATTDADGKACISFRIPWPCADPVNEIFGWWYVNATVEVAEQVAVDNLKFFVYWPVFVLSVEPKAASFTQRKTGGDTMMFTVTYGTYFVQPQHAIITCTVYDELGFFIGAAYTIDDIANDWSSYLAAIPFTKTWDVSIPMPTNAVVGKGTVYADAFTNWPWNGGYPYCPEVSNTFYIVKP